MRTINFWKPAPDPATPRLKKMAAITDEELLTPAWSKILNIRHPFERLYSGWRDKFDPNNLDCPRFVRSYKPKIMPFERNKSHPRFKIKTCDKLKSGSLVTFYAFLKYVLHEPFSQLNQHFLPIAHVCSPCHVDWDFISTQPTVNDDIVTAFQSLGKKSAADEKFIREIAAAKNQSKLSSFNSYPKKRTAKMAFYDICQQPGGKKLVQDLRKKYDWDFTLFGYDLEGYFHSDADS